MSTAFITTLLLILSATLSTIQSQTICPTNDTVIDLDYLYAPNSCNGGLIPPYSIFINNAQNYNVLYTQPSGLYFQWLSSSSVSIILPLDEPLNVTIYYGDSTCVRKQEIEHTNYFQVGRPKCSYSQVTVISQYTGCSWPTIDGNDFSTDGVTSSFPYLTISTGDHTLSCNFDGQTCSSPLFIQPPQADNIPKLLLEPAPCDSVGYVQVLNNASYSSLRLYRNGPLEFFNITDGGNTFGNLIAREYFLEAISDTCGNQTIRVGLDDSFIPSIIVTPNEKMQCVSNENYTVEFRDPSRYKPGVTFGINYNMWSGSTSFSYDQCEAYYYLSYPLTPLPYNHSIDYSSICSNGGNGSVLVTIDSTFPSLNIVDQNWQTIPVLNNNSFWATIGSTYKASIIDCNNLPYMIKVSLPEPVIVETPLSADNQRSCLFNTTLYVLNYLDFDPNTLRLEFEGSYPVSYQFNITAVNGVFKNIPRLKYTLHYDYLTPNGTSSCFSGTKDVILDTVQLSSENYTVNVLGYNGTCSQSTIGLEFVFSNGLSVSTWNEYNGYMMWVEVSPYCIAFLDYDVLTKNTTIPANYNITVVDGKCIYDPRMGFTITPTPNANGENIEGVYINGVRQQITTFNYNLSPGTYDIMVVSKYYSQSHYYCSVNQTITVQNTDPTGFQMTCSAVPVNDTCSGTGSIVCVGTSTLVSYQVDYGSLSAMPAYGVSYSFNGLKGGMHSVQISTDACPPLDGVSGYGGIAYLNIPSSPNDDIIISHNVRRPSTCDSGDAFVTFDVFNPVNNVSMKIDSIYYKGINYPTSYLSHVAAATNIEIGLVVANCNLTYTIDKIEQVPFDSLFTFTATGETCNAPSVVEITPSQYVSIDAINSDHCNANEGFYNKIYNCYSGNVNLEISWNQGCKATFTVNVPEPKAPIAPQYVVSPASTCGALDAHITISNIDQFQYIGFYDSVADPHTGVAYILQSTESKELNYVDINGCSNLAIIQPDAWYPGINITSSGISIQSETCTGSMDGQVVVPTDNGKRYQLYIEIFDSRSEGPSQNLFSVLMAQTSPGLYGNLGAGRYLLLESTPDDWHCMSQMIFVLESGEPTLSLLSPSCSSESGGPLNIMMTSSSAANGTDAFNGFTMTLTNSTATTEYNANNQPIQFTDGETYQATFNNTNPKCRRVFTATLVKEDTNVTANITNMYTSNLVTFSEIEECDGDGNSKKNLAWIAAVVIGAALIGLGIGFLVYRMRRRIPTSKVDIPTDQKIELKTVPVFTAGKIQNLDEF